MSFEPSVLLTLVGALLAGGAAVGAVRQQLSAMGRQLGEHMKSDEKHQRDAIERLARIETILTERK